MMGGKFMSWKSMMGSEVHEWTFMMGWEVHEWTFMMGWEVHELKFMMGWEVRDMGCELHINEWTTEWAIVKLQLPVAGSSGNASLLYGYLASRTGTSFCSRV